jgi:nucleoside-diphosphate-sugar epimerase
MILVTGATGHAGRAVACRLASLGHDVVAMVRAAGACHLESCRASRTMRMPQLCTGRSRASMSDGNTRAVISFLEQRPGVRQIA